MSLMHRLNLNDILLHLPSRDTLPIHLVNLSSISARALRKEHVEKNTHHHPRAEEQPGRLIAPVHPSGIHQKPKSALIQRRHQQRNLQMIGSEVLKVRPNSTDKPDVTPAVLARSFWEETSPANAKPRLPTKADCQ